MSMEPSNLFTFEEKVRLSKAETERIRRTPGPAGHPICGIVVGSSWHEPVACAYPPGHDGDYPAAREEALTAGDQGEQSDGTGRVAPADGCAERQSPALPSPAASDDPAYERLSSLVGRTLVRVEITTLGVMFRFSGGYAYWAAGNLARGGAR